MEEALSRGGILGIGTGADGTLAVRAIAGSVVITHR